MTPAMIDTAVLDKTAWHVRDRMLSNQEPIMTAGMLLISFPLYTSLKQDMHVTDNLDNEMYYGIGYNAA